MTISRQKEARSRDYALLLFRMTSRVFYSTHYHRQHFTLHEFEQFGALYICTTTMTNIRPDRDSNLVPPRLQAPVDTNEPSGPASFDYNIGYCCVSIYHTQARTHDAYTYAHTNAHMHTRTHARIYTFKYRMYSLTL